MKKNYIISEDEKERMLKFLEIMERNPKAAVTEGWRRTANIMDEVEFMYSSCSSGKDSHFTTQMAMMELQRRRYLLSLLESTDENEQELGNELFERYQVLRRSGLASNSEDTLENMRKWDGLRVAVLQMSYELEYDQSGHVMHRLYKEYATDIRNILPKEIRSKYIINPQYKTQMTCENTKLGYDLLNTGRYTDDCWSDPVWESNKSVQELGFDLRWINTKERKYNPHELSEEDIVKMKPAELRGVYGKALLYGFMVNSPLSWETNTATNGESRYISYDPRAKKIWVTPLPDQWDPHSEWSISQVNMYEPWHGLAPNLVCYPAMTDQLYRTEFSKFISDVIPLALQAGWPERYYNMATGEYDA